MVAVAVWSAVLPGAALADTGDDAATTTPPPASAAALEVTATPLVAEGRGDGDLVAAAEETGLAALFFSPSQPSEQRAVHEIRIRNTGDVPVFDLAVSDDRMGEIVAAGSVVRLEPGEEIVARAALTVTFDEVASGLAGLSTTTTTAVARTDDGTEVTATAGTVVGLVAVLAAPTIDVTLEIVPGVGVVPADGTPVVQWTAAERDADEARVVRFRVSVTNSSTVDLSDVEVTADVLGAALVSGGDGLTLAPGAVLVREFEREIRPAALEVDAARGATVDLATTVTATAVDTTQDLTASARDTVVLKAVLAAPTPVEGAPPPPPQLPAAGLGTSREHIPLAAVLSLALGLLLLRGRRPVVDGPRAAVD